MKRPAGKLALFLLLLAGGAIINIVVAWGCALWASIDDFRLQAPTPTQISLWHMFVETANAPMGATRSESGGLVYEQVSGALEPNQWILLFDETGASSGTSTETWPNTPFGRIVAVSSCGWPLLSLRGIRHEPRLPVGERQTNTGEWTSLVRTDRGSLCDDSWLERPPSVASSLQSAVLIPVKDRAITQYRLLPIGLLFPGFAINTVFYAALLWLMFAVPFALRRSIRRRRGLCPACAYPVGENDVCTECGKPLVKQKAETQKAETQKAQTT